MLLRREHPDPHRCIQASAGARRCGGRELTGWSLRGRLAWLAAGLWLFGTGGAFIVSSALGNEPWTVLAQGLARHTPISLGGANALIGVLVLAAWLPLRERPGVGTLLNVVVISVALDVMLVLLSAPESLVARFAWLLLGIALVGLGSGMYLSAGLGPGPRDGLMTGLTRRYGFPLWRVRMGLECTALVGGWLLGGTVGVGTVAFALLIGPAVQLTLRLCAMLHITASPAGAAAGVD